MADLASLTRDSFTGHVGEPFRLVAAGDGDAAPHAPVQLRLTAAEPLGDPLGDGSRAPFSLMFTGPPEPIVPQAIHRLEHDALGPLELFLVPVQPVGDGARYQAVFT